MRLTSWDSFELSIRVFVLWYHLPLKQKCYLLLIARRLPKYNYRNHFIEYRSNLQGNFSRIVSKDFILAGILLWRSKLTRFWIVRVDWNYQLHFTFKVNGLLKVDPAGIHDKKQ